MVSDKVKRACECSQITVSLCVELNDDHDYVKWGFAETIVCSVTLHRSSTSSADFHCNEREALLVFKRGSW